MSDNGHAGPTPEQVAQAAALLQQVEGPMRAVVGTVLRGLLISFPGIPPHVILNSFCHVAGFMAASSVQADLATLFAIRGGFKEAFAEGVQQAKMVTPPLTQPAPGPGEGTMPDYSKLLKGG